MAYSGVLGGELNQRNELVRTGCPQGGRVPFEWFYFLNCFLKNKPNEQRSAAPTRRSHQKFRLEHAHQPMPTLWPAYHLRRTRHRRCFSTHPPTGSGTSLETGPCRRCMATVSCKCLVDFLVYNMLRSQPVPTLRIGSLANTKVLQHACLSALLWSPTVMRCVP